MQMSCMLLPLELPCQKLFGCPSAATIKRGMNSLSDPHWMIEIGYAYTGNSCNHTVNSIWHVLKLREVGYTL